MIASTHNLTLIDNFTHAAVLHNGAVIELGEIPVLEKKGPFLSVQTLDRLDNRPKG